MPSPSASDHRPVRSARPLLRAASAPELQLLLVALIWGLEFVVQRQGVLGAGPFRFNAASFGLGTLVLGVRRLFSRNETVGDERLSRRGGILAGLALFGAMSLQSGGIGESGAGKTAFITSLYIVLVPLAGLFAGRRAARATWIGCGLSLVGLWLLCVGSDLSLRASDLFVLASTVFWSAHILLVDRFASRSRASSMAFWQFATCALLSLSASLVFEAGPVPGLGAVIVPVLYNGILSAGVAFSLQIVAQSRLKPARAALILSLETLFAALGGWILLHEHFGGRELVGGAFMLAGVLASRRGRPGAGS